MVMSLVEAAEKLEREQRYAEAKCYSPPDRATEMSDTPSGERRCAVGVGSQGEPIFEQFVRLVWHKEKLRSVENELADTKSSLMRTANELRAERKAHDSTARIADAEAELRQKYGDELAAERKAREDLKSEAAIKIAEEWQRAEAAEQRERESNAREKEWLDKYDAERKAREEWAAQATNNEQRRWETQQTLDKLLADLSEYSQREDCGVCRGAGCIGIPGAKCDACDGFGKNRLALAFRWIEMEKQVTLLTQRAEAAKATIERYRQPLMVLVELKQMKRAIEEKRANNEITLYYEAHKETAWRDAERALGIDDQTTRLSTAMGA